MPKTKAMDPKTLHRTLATGKIMLKDTSSKKKFVHNGETKNLETKLETVEAMYSKEELDEFFEQVFWGETCAEFGTAISKFEITSKRKS